MFKSTLESWGVYNSPGEFGFPPMIYRNHSLKKDTETRAERANPPVDEIKSSLKRTLNQSISAASDDDINLAFEILQSLKSKLRDKDFVPIISHTENPSNLINYFDLYNTNWESRRKFWQTILKADCANPRALSIATTIWALGHEGLFSIEEKAAFLDKIKQRSKMRVPSQSTKDNPKRRHPLRQKNSENKENSTPKLPPLSGLRL